MGLLDVMSRYRRGRHVATRFSRRVADIEADLNAEAKVAKEYTTERWPVVVHEGREYWEVECVFWPDGNFEGETAYIAIAPSTEDGVIGIVTAMQPEEAAWTKQASGSA